jgi:hypothetical protein
MYLKQLNNYLKFKVYYNSGGINEFTKSKIAPFEGL